MGTRHKRAMERPGFLVLIPRDCAIIALASLARGETHPVTFREILSAVRTMPWARKLRARTSGPRPTPGPACTPGGSHDTPRVASGMTACAKRVSEVLGKNHSAAPAWVSVGGAAGAHLGRTRVSGSVRGAVGGREAELLPQPGRVEEARARRGELVAELRQAQPLRHG